MPDLRHLAEEYRALKHASDDAREQLRRAVIAAIDAGLSQRQAHLQTGIDRPTIARWWHTRNND